MLTRRRVLALTPAVLAQRRLAAQTQTPPRLAVIGNTYHYGSELQIIADRFLVGYAHEGDWRIPNLKLVSMYVESRARSAQGATNRPRGQARPQAAAEPRQETGPLADLSADRAREFGFRLYRSIPEPLRSGGDNLPVAPALAVATQTD